MKIQVTQENLNRALNAVSRVANTRGTLPILANVLLRTNNNRLSISATNLDIAITYFIGTKIKEEGSITVPARLLQDYISGLPSGVINLDLEDTKLHITTSKYKSIMNGIIADDFPEMPSPKREKTWTVKASVFKSAIQQIGFTASSDETRPVLTGVLLHLKNNELLMASTDSYRLAEKNLGKTDHPQNTPLLIPANTLQDLLRVINDEDEKVTIINDDQQALFKVGEVELVTRLLNGKYPEYSKLIPANFETTATLKKTDFLNVAKVSSLFARESAGSVTIEVDKKDKQISIRSVASQLGENTASAEAETTGEGSITLNSRYLIDALNAFVGEEVRFGFNGKLEPTLLTDPKNKDYKHVIMPLKS